MAWGVVLNSIWATSSCSHCSHRHRAGKGQRTSKPWPSETRSYPAISTPGGRSTSMVTLAMAPPGSMPLRDAGSRRSRLQGTDGQDDKPKDWLRQKGEKYRGLALYSGRTNLGLGDGCRASNHYGDRQDLLYLRLRQPRLDDDVILRQGRRALPSCLVRLHLLGGDAYPVGIRALKVFHRRMRSLPGHPEGALQDHFQAVQQDPVELLLQRRPAAFDPVVLAVVRRIVDQPDLQPRPVGELHPPLHKLRPPPRVLRPVVQVDHQAFDVPESGPDLTPPHLQRIDPGVAGLPRSEQQHQRPGRYDQDAEWDQFLLRGRVVVPSLRHFTVRVCPGFSPRERTRPGPPWPSCPWRSPASRARRGPVPAPPPRWRRSRRSARSSSAACPSGSA